MLLVFKFSKPSTLFVFAKFIQVESHREHIQRREKNVQNIFKLQLIAEQPMQYVDYFLSPSFDSHWNEFQLEIWKAGIKLFFPLDSFISYTELNWTGENSYAYYSWKELRIQNADLSGKEHEHSLHAEWEFGIPLHSGIWKFKVVLFSSLHTKVTKWSITAKLIKSPHWWGVGGQFNSYPKDWLCK